MATVPTSTFGRLANKVAVVTGSSSGIGRAIALAYAREGAKVICADVQPGARDLVQDELNIFTHDMITKSGGVAVFHIVDVGDEEQVKDLVNQTVKIFGKIDM